MKTQEVWNQDFIQYRSAGNKRTYLAFLEKMQFNEPKGHCILDVGCGDGSLLQVLVAKGYENAFGLEIADDLYRNSPVAERITNGSIVDVSKMNRKFHVVIFRGVLHHLTTLADIRTAIENSARLLHSGGKILVFEPWPTLLRPVLTMIGLSPLALLSRKYRHKRRLYLLEKKDVEQWLRNCPQVMVMLKRQFAPVFERTDIMYKYFCGTKRS